MKVITEEKLDEQIEVANKMLKSGCIYDIRSLKDYHLQELDTLTVTRLRPMSEAPEIQSNEFAVHALVRFEHMSTFQIRRFELYKGWTDTDLHLALGWIPMPRYEPEATK